MEDKFNAVFDKYKNIPDKYDSQYIFVIHNLPIDVCLEKIAKMLVIIETSTNPTKKSYRRTKIKNFQDYMEGIKKESIINSVFMVSKTVDEISFDKYWKQTLLDFKCETFIVNYAEYFPLDWLKGLLLDRTYIHILHLRNNTVKHIHLNKTKKRLFQEKNEHKLDMDLYITSNVPKDDVCLVHGISSFMKFMKDSNKVKILNGDMKDEQLLGVHENIINEQNCEKLQWWLDRMTLPKEGKKIVFGCEIKECIKNKMLETLFCSSDVKLKILEKVHKEEQIFELIEINNSNDIGKRLEIEFKGAIGIKFY